MYFCQRLERFPLGVLLRGSSRCVIVSCICLYEAYTNLVQPTSPTPKAIERIEAEQEHVDEIGDVDECDPIIVDVLF